MHRSVEFLTHCKNIHKTFFCFFNSFAYLFKTRMRLLLLSLELYSIFCIVYFGTGCWGVTYTYWLHLFQFNTQSTLRLKSKYTLTHNAMIQHLFLWTGDSRMYKTTYQSIFLIDFFSVSFWEKLWKHVLFSFYQSELTQSPY